MSGDEPEPRPPGLTRVIAPVVAATAIIALAVVFLGSRGSDTPSGPTAAPAASATAVGTPAVTDSAVPSAGSTSPAPVGGPTAEAAAAFAEANGPADHTATGDVDGDGVVEVVVALVRNESTHIVVGAWDGERYRRVFTDDGGPAGTVERIEVRDYNGQPGAEIVTTQAVGDAGSSLSVWGVDGRRIRRQIARGGCWDGFHTFGISGATIEQGRIAATCDGSPLPREAWTRDVYEWSGGAWKYTTTQEPEG